jgi:hypothetical protein
VRLVDLHPRWVNDLDAPPNAKQGVSFDCPCCVGNAAKGGRLAVFFANPITPCPPADISLENRFKWAHEHDHLTDHHVGGVLWQRTGETFETLTLAPSIDCSRWGHWHGFITNGVCSGGGAVSAVPTFG